MGNISPRGIQATNMVFSSWALVFLAIGIIMEEWVELTLETKKNTHSFCFPTDGLEVVRTMMILVLILSFIHNLFLGLESTYLIPQTKHTLFIAVFLSFFTGLLLLCALLMYHQKLSQGKTVYYSSYKITWIIFTAYLNVSLFVASGVLSLLQYKQSIKSFACLTILRTSSREIKDRQESESSIKVISLPEQPTMLRSIVHTKEDFPNRAHIQTRRVTWAV
ncbi:transmembrane protein 225 isoform X2 [Panthera tigris]|uniref:transmembrane protein 225 isoform X2 n=1 Tax=Panthera leo TaxID=9689 RepID=UPI001C6A512A|nr:transmembrane protein 225 isoform X2 [Panthera leo]XP_042815121.1 transmembrane protein 225 isoform X2 [Panthera tigris]